MVYKASESKCYYIIIVCVELTHAFVFWNLNLLFVVVIICSVIAGAGFCFVSCKPTVCYLVKETIGFDVHDVNVILLLVTLLLLFLL